MSSTQPIHTRIGPAASAAQAPSAAGAAGVPWKSLYILGGAAALVAFAANVLDVVLGFGETELAAAGSKSAADWFALYNADWFNGLYVLGILNIVYMAAMIPVYLALWSAHRRANPGYAALAVILAFLGMAIYIANNAAIPMLVLAEKYAAATTEAHRTALAAAGETVLARGEDFTPGSFIGLILGASGALVIALVMLRSEVFGKLTAWIGVVGFTCLWVFTVWATLVPVLYALAFYLFGMVGGLLALAWFLRVALGLFRLGRAENEPVYY